MKALVIAAHPDDEVLGCGATIAKHTQRGDEVHVLILAEGATSRKERRNRLESVEDLSELADAAKKARDILKVNVLMLHDLPDNRMDSIDVLEVVKIIEQYIQSFRPEIIYTHHAGDLNIDHRITHEAVVTACRPVPGSPIRTLLFFEIPSSTEWMTGSLTSAFTPNWYVDVSDTLENKIEALKAYHKEMRSWPHPRSLEAVTHLARWRGSTVGVAAAEAFITGRNLIK